MEKEIKNAPVEAAAAQENGDTGTQGEAVERRIRKSVRDRYPDFASEDENEWAAKEDELFGEIEDENSEFKKSEKELEDIITAEPELANVLNDMVVNKMPFRVAIAKHFSQEDLLPVEGDEDYDAYMKEYNDRVERGKLRSQKEAEIAKNENATYDEIDAFAEENGLDEGGKTALIEHINQFFSDLLMKRISKDMLKFFYNGMNHDGDVETAAKEGEIKGRNAKIEQDIEDEDRTESGDGIPYVDKGGETVKDTNVEKEDVFDKILKSRNRI